MSNRLTYAQQDILDLLRDGCEVQLIHRYSRSWCYVWSSTKRNSFRYNVADCHIATIRSLEKRGLAKLIEETDKFKRWAIA